MSSYYYSSATGQSYSADQMLAGFGINTETTDIEILNYRGFYPVQPSSPDFDTTLYQATFTWAIVPIAGGEGAAQVWAATPLPLAQAQANASFELKATANAAVDIEACGCGFTTDMLTGVASQAEIDRPSRYQAELDEIATIAGELDSNLTSVETATSVDEINAIVHQPYGTLNTGRGGPGQAGPLDLNLSYFSEINNLPGFTQADLELYVPGTDTVIPYDAGLPDPYKFDSAGNCFASGDYRLVIRYAGAGAVLSTITVPEGANVDVPWTYNPTIPPAAGGSSEAF